MNAPMKNPEADQIETVTVEPKRKSNLRRNLLMGVVPLALVFGGGYFWLTGGRFVDTDNAYVQQPKVAISADIAGRVIEVDVRENQVVAAGDLLFKLDPAPYEIALSQAEAALATARVNVEQLRVSFATAKAKLASAEDGLELRQAEYDRKASLASQGVAAQASLDEVKQSLQTAQSNVTLAQQEVAAATAALSGNPQIPTEEHPAVRTALAARDTAQRNLEKTTVTAPAGGIVSQVASLNVGQFVAAGSTIASLVETSQTWVQANFKETQLGTIVAGMPADIAVDAFPGVVLHGHVDSIGAATGSEFALIPAQNATGNWVKVTQRVPVRIVVDEESANVLRSGLSAVVSVDTGKTTLDGFLGKPGV